MEKESWFLETCRFLNGRLEANINEAEALSDMPWLFKPEIKKLLCGKGIMVLKLAGAFKLCVAPGFDLSQFAAVQHKVGMACSRKLDL